MNGLISRLHYSARQRDSFTHPLQKNEGGVRVGPHGRSYKNHFVCVRKPERQTVKRQLQTNAAKRQRRRRCGLTIEENKQDRTTSERKDQRTWAKTGRYTLQTHKGLVRRLDSAGELHDSGVLTQHSSSVSQFYWDWLRNREGEGAWGVMMGQETLAEGGFCDLCPWWKVIKETSICWEYLKESATVSLPGGRKNTDSIQET